MRSKQLYVNPIFAYSFYYRDDTTYFSVASHFAIFENRHHQLNRTHLCLFPYLELDTHE